MRRGYTRRRFSCSAGREAISGRAGSIRIGHSGSAVRRGGIADAERDARTNADTIAHTNTNSDSDTHAKAVPRTDKKADGCAANADSNTGTHAGK